MKIRQVLSLGIIALFIVLIKTSFADETLRPVKMACSPFSPFKIENSENGQKGIDIEIMQEVFALSSRKIEYNYYPWKRAVKLVETGKADGLCGCSYHPDRENNFIFSDIVGEHSQGVFLADGVELNEFNSVKDLQGLSIATVRGYSVQKELKDHGINTYEARDDDELLTILQNGRVDAIYTYRDILLYALSHSGKSGHVNYRELTRKPYYFCFSPTQSDIEDIVEEVNQGLRIIRYNGTYDKIWKSYQ